jgi:hypothetical protein
MVSIGNRFYRGIVHSPVNQPHPNFRFILVDTVREIQDENGNYYTDSFAYYEDYLLHNPDHGDVFYGVYGSYWPDIPKNGLKISETDSLQQAINIAEAIMGTKIIETKLPL